jgi:hypothetical protein
MIVWNSDILASPFSSLIPAAVVGVLFTDTINGVKIEK